MTFARRSLKTLPKLPPSPFDRRYGRRRTKKGRSRASVQTSVRERVETSRAEHATSASPFAFVLLAQPGVCTCHPERNFQHASDGEHSEAWFRIPHLGQYQSRLRSGLNVLPSPNPTGGDLNVLPSPNPTGGGLNVLPSSNPTGGDLNVLPSPNPAGGDLNVLPSPNPAGGDLNMLPSPNPAGGDLNMLPSPNPAGGDLNVLPSPNPAGGDLNVLPWPSPVGSGWMCYQRTTIHLIPTGGGVDMLAAAGCAAELHQPGRNIWQPIPSDTSHPYHCYFRAIRPQKLHFIPAAGAQ
ncbi:hypothetical protein C8R47DRAFT_1314519 [Mycena vitilis]|nr:hypothetical protein C8R47DRAFT_1314519 [Mycena vitilis]